MQNNNSSLRKMNKSQIEELKQSLSGCIRSNISKYGMQGKVEVEDIFHEALIRAIQVEASKKIDNIVAFLKVVVKNILREYKRKYSRLPMMQDGSKALEEIVSHSENTATLEEIELVNNIYSYLTNKEEFTLIFCKEVEELTWTEVVEKMGGKLKVDAAKKKAQRAKENIRKNFKKEGDDMYKN
jgi:DNA-directed RNA polymerase specialized sigma24 family protein